MSRHIFDATLGEQPMRVTVGYDRPSGLFFLHIGWVDPRTGAVVAYASDLNLAYDPNDWRTIRRFLASLQIIAPASVWTELACDALAKTGNRVVKHSSDGTLQELFTR
jgi:hypothetical protein